MFGDLSPALSGFQEKYEPTFEVKVFEPVPGNESEQTLWFNAWIQPIVVLPKAVDFHQHQWWRSIRTVSKQILPASVL